MVGLRSRVVIPSEAGLRPARLRARVAAVAVAVAAGFAGLAIATAPDAAAAGSCTITWAGAATGNWSTAANWSPAAIPGSAGRTADEVCIPSTATVSLDVSSYTVAAVNDNGTSPGNLVGSGGSLTITGTGSVAASALGSVTFTTGSLTVNSPAPLSTTSLTIGSSATTAGSLGGSGAVSVAGPFALSGGGISSNNMVITQTASSTAAFTSATFGVTTRDAYYYSTSFVTPNDVTIGGTLNTSGSAITATGTGRLLLASGVNVTGGATFTASGVTTAAGTATVTPTLVLTGTNTSLAGDLSVGGLAVNAGATLAIPSPRTVTNTGGTTTVNGTINGTGTLAFTGGSMTVTSSGTLSPTALTMTGGQLTTAAASTVAPTGVTLTGGSWTANDAALTPATIGSGGLTVGSSATTIGNIGGSGAITVAGPFALNGGGISTSNTVITQTGSFTAAITSATFGLTTRDPSFYSTSLITPNDVTINGTLNTSGSAITASGTSRLLLGSGAAITGGATLTASGVTTVAGGANVAPSLVMTGTNTSLSGDLSVGGLAVNAGASVAIPSPRTVTNTGGSVAVNGTINGTGTLSFTGGSMTVNASGTLSPTALTMTGGQLTTSAASTVAPTGITINGGTWTANNASLTPATIGSGGLTIGSSATTIGSLAGSGAITVAGPFALNGGGASTSNMVITQTGSFTAAITSAAFGLTTRDPYYYSTSLVTPNDVTINGTLNTSSSAITASGTSRLLLGSGVNVTGGATLAASGVTTLAGGATLQPTLLVTGTNTSLAGDLSVGGLAVNAGASVAIPSPRIITTTAGSTTVNGAITGTGTLSFTGGSMTVGASGTLSPTALTMTGGQLTTSAASTVAPTGVTINGGSWTANNAALTPATIGSGGLTIGSSATTIGSLAGSGAITVAGPFALNGGGASTSNMVITQTGSFTAAITSATFGLTTRDPYYYSTSLVTPNDVTINGTLNTSSSAITATGTSRLLLGSGVNVTGGATFTASGVTTVSGGAALAATLVVTGTNTSLAGDLSVGGLAVNAGASVAIPSPRTVTNTGGTVAVNGTINGTGTVALTGGSMTVGSTGTLSPTALTMTGGQLTTSAASTVAPTGITINGGTWTANNATLTPATIGSGGLTIGSSATTIGNLAGNGAITVAGPFALTGGGVSSGNLTITQTGSFTAAISSVTFGVTTRDPYYYSTSLTTPNDVTISGTLNTSASAITVTGSSRLLLASGVNVTGGATFTASGISTAGPSNASVQPTLVLTGATTTLSGNLTAYDLRVANGGSLYLPSARTITAPSQPVQVLVGGVLTGAGTISGPVQNRGTVAPGDNAAGDVVGTLTAASYRQESTGTTAIQLSSGGSDAVATTGATATYVDGIVAITRLGGFTPAAGASVTVVSSPGASSNAVVAPGASTTDDLVSGHFGPPTVSAKNVVVSLGATVPGAPGLALVAGPAKISATVTAPSSDGGAAITNYRVSCSPDCGGNHDSAAAGVVALTGLTPGTPYTVSVIAQNSVGDSTATTLVATPTVVVVPKATVTPSTTKLVITTGGTFKATCRYNVALVKTCAVTAKSASGVVLATGKAVTVLAGASAVSETMTLTAAGITAAKAAGGVTVVLTATVTPVTGSALVAKGSLVVVNKTVKVTLLGGVLFSSNSATLSSAGKTALIKISKQIQGAKQLECDGHTANTGNPTGEYKLGLQRATVVCNYIKAEIKLLKLKPILKYVVKSYGATRPVSRTNLALNRRVELLVSN